MAAGDRHRYALLQEARLPIGSSNQRSDSRQVKGVSGGAKQ